MENLISLQNTLYSNNNDILLSISNKLDNIVEDLRGKINIDIICNKIKDIITTIDKTINDNKNNYVLIKQDMEKIMKEYDDLKQNISNNNIVIKTEIYNNGKYTGEFKNGLKDGRGIFYYTNGDKYEGDWKNDCREGKGVFYFKDGDKYEGDFKKSKKDGKGIYYYKGGNRYEGELKNDKKEGKGIFYLTNGNRVMGDYLNDNPIGNHAVLDINGNISSYNY